MKKVSILVPVYNEGDNLFTFFNEVTKVTSQIANYEFEYVFVDDGSRDNSVKILEDLASKNKKVIVLELSRNFGKEIALTAGIDSLKTDAVIIMDADLQHPPKYIPEFIKHWEDGFEIVATQRVSIQKQPLFRKLGSYFFYKILNFISEFQTVPQTTDFRLLDKIVIEALKEFRERNRMVRGLIDWMGFKKTFIPFEAPERFAGEARYSYSKLVRLAVNSMTSFSLFPLRLAGYFGILISTVFGCLFIFMVLNSLFLHITVFSALSYVIVINSFLIGIVLSCLGLIALYIGHIYIEVIDRPLYIVRKKKN
ncbi:MAG: glycosyltransferase family 2 protein [Leptospiraceae bacterium]|nr:glycosyltransferase family 2 protein [Leptospiraceae bacterium]